MVDDRSQSGLSQDESILAIDNVRLQLPIAGVGSRILAASLDYLLLAVLQLLWLLGGMLSAGALGLGGGWAMAVVLFGLFLIQWGYFAALEILTDGPTVGKRALGLRVVSSHGGQAGAAAIVVRNLIRTIDLFVGIPLFLFDRRARRLGDMVAGTLVIHERLESAGELRLERVPAGCGAREVALLEGFLQRARHMDPERSRGLAAQLLRWLERQDPELASDRDASLDPVAQLEGLLLAQPPRARSG